MTVRKKLVTQKHLAERGATYASRPLATKKAPTARLKSKRTTRDQAIDRAMDFVLKFHWDTLKELAKH